MTPDKPKTDEEYLEAKRKLQEMRDEVLIEETLAGLKPKVNIKKLLEGFNSKKNAQQEVECKDCMESMERKVKAVCNIAIGEELAKQLAEKDREIEELEKELRIAVDHIQEYEKEVESLKQERQGFLEKLGGLEKRIRNNKLEGKYHPEGETLEHFGWLYAKDLILKEIQKFRKELEAKK